MKKNQNNYSSIGSRCSGGGGTVVECVIFVFDSIDAVFVFFFSVIIIIIIIIVVVVVIVGKGRYIPTIGRVRIGTKRYTFDCLDTIGKSDGSGGRW